MSVEEMERGREHDRVRHEERCSNMSTEELEMMRERNRANQQERREEARGDLSPEQAELIRENERLRRQLARSNMTPEQRQLFQERNALYRHLQQIGGLSTESGIVERNEYKENVREITPQDISGNIQVEQCIQACQESLCQTILHEEEADYEENKENHRMLTCVVCDEAIIGKDVYHWIDRKTLKFHGNVLSHTYFYKDGINNLLKAQYTLVDEHLHGLLLSPRSRRRTCAGGDPSYMCCSICYEDLKELKKRKKPPKYAISNGFAIGHLPETLSVNITPLVNNLVAPVRAFNYFIAFNGGKEQKITGNFTFFAQDVPQNIGALQHMAVANNNPSIFIVLLGSFTPGQLEKIRTKGSYNVENFRRIYQFLHDNNEHYALLPPLENIPMPRVEQIYMNEEEGGQPDVSLDSIIENQICWKYWFPSVEDPNGHSGTYQNQSEFAQALFGGYTPTMFYHPTKVISYAKLSELCPIAFPFGTGDVDCKRSPAVSEVECLQHYLKLSLPQFLEGQTVLIIHHLFQRRKSFLSGIAKCNMSNNGNTIASQLATISVDELEHAIREMRNMPPRCSDSPRESAMEEEISPHVKELIKCIRTSCTPIGYTNEAAAEARTKMFALWMTFGSPSLFFTLSPCDECSFKMQLYATAASEELPSVKLPVEILSRKLALRRALRVKYPGACAREFHSLLQIVLADLIGWEGLDCKKLGIFGKVLAHCIGVEEQGRTSLHGHIVLWIKAYYDLQQQLFSNDENIRREAKKYLERYLDKVLSATFDILDSEVNRCLHVNTECQPSDDKIMGVSLQSLREMRHIQLLKNHCGRIVTCDDCKRSWDTAEVVNSVIKELLFLSRVEYPTFWPEDITFPLSHEQVELLALRYQNDMIHIPAEKEHTRRLLELVVLLFFNTHDWHHRKGCFKKSKECRFHIPHKPYHELSIQLNEVDMDILQSNNAVAGISRSKWHSHDGSHHYVCSYDILAQRKPWDVFVNTNNPIVSKILGYNNNICMGSINTLYYCTLYTSKSNQEDETMPYLKALEAVSKRIKRVQESDSEEALSSRQVGLRHLLSGINSHLSSCVVSATMAWYLVIHGSRFHFSHQFKPLLLSQVEDWYKGRNFKRRIRYQKRKRNAEIATGGMPSPINGVRSPTTESAEEDQSRIWFESSIHNYIFRPLNGSSVMFENISMWEYESNYDLVVLKPDNFMTEEQQHDSDNKYFRFQHGHPGLEFSCLVKRNRECIPKLYYNSKFPDVELLEMEMGNDVEDHVKQLREDYALKAMLLFCPFRSKEDLHGDYATLWDSFLDKKNTLLTTNANVTQHQFRSLYKHSLQILQNIQDLINIKKIPTGVDLLESCTDLYDVDISNGRASYFEGDEDQLQNAEDDDLNIDSHILQLSQYVTLLSQETSTFNNGTAEMQQCRALALSPTIVSITPSNLQSDLPGEGDRGDGREGTGSEINENSNEDANATGHEEVHENIRRNHSVITVITRALNDEDSAVIHHPTFNYNVENSSYMDGGTLTGIDNAMCSMDHFVLQNNLDRKQTLAFQVICTSFMLSFLKDPSLDISPTELEEYQQKLQRRGAKEQLLMCVTGPGGSGKSHVMKCCRMYCKLFCDSIAKPFNFSVFPVTATSNSAASLLQGITIHSAAMLNNKVVQMELSTDVDWTMTKVLIIDEISMADKNMFQTLDKNLRLLTGNRRVPYGGIHIIFSGDFMQLKPVQGTPIYSSFDDILWHGSLNAAVFFDDRNHRFINDPVWGEILQRAQVGLITDEDIVKINERLLSKVSLPDNIDCTRTRFVYGCYSNKKRNQITNATFLKFVSNDSPTFTSANEPSTSSLIVKGLVTKQKRDVGPDFHKLLWATCGDDNLTVGTASRVDPCLKLIQGCAVMINQNIDKKQNIVKGAMGNYVGVRWKHGKGPHVEDYYGYKVNFANVRDIEYLVIKLRINGKFVEVRPEEFSVTIKFPGCNSKNLMKGYQIQQFPINLALAITGHKLQGMTLDMMVLSEVNKTSNWLYVMLSRVTTLKGLFLMVPLKKTDFRPICPNLRQELEFLRDLELKLILGLESS